MNSIYAGWDTLKTNFDSGFQSGFPYVRRDPQTGRVTPGSPYVSTFSELRSRFPNGSVRSALLSELESCLCALKSAGADPRMVLLSGNFFDFDVDDPQFPNVAVYYKVNPSRPLDLIRLRSEKETRSASSSIFSIIPLDSEDLLLIRMTLHWSGTFSMADDGYNGFPLVLLITDGGAASS